MEKKKTIFFCIGAQKAGTTTLHDILSQNKQIALPKDKETHFFSLASLYNPNEQDYLKKYFNSKQLKHAQIVGEIDPSYSYFHDTEKRIFNTFSKNYNVKFIFILRDPVKRAYSHYLMSKSRGYEHLTFTEAISNEKERIKTDHFSNVNFSYISRGFYSSQIEKYLKYFDLKDFLFIRFEDDFIHNKQQTLIRIESFLNIKHFNYNFDLKSNPASEPKSEIVRDILYKDNKFKTFFSKLVFSSRVRKTIKKTVTNLNLKETENSKLDNTTLKRLYQTYYKDEVELLEKKIELNLSNWKHY